MTDQPKLSIVPTSGIVLPKSGGPGGGNGSGDSELEKRVEALEKAIPEMRERLVRVETKLDSMERNMATQANMADLRADFAKEFGGIRTDLAEETGTINQSVANFRTEITRLEGTLIKWFIVTALALSGGIGTIAFGLARALK